MINYFYSIYKKDADTTYYLFYKGFAIFIFFLLFSVIGYTTTVLYIVINTFYEFDYSYVVIFNISVSIVYPISHVFFPGYQISPKVEKYSKDKITIIQYFSIIGVFILFLTYLQIISWILYPESNFSILKWK